MDIRQYFIYFYLYKGIIIKINKYDFLYLYILKLGICIFTNQYNIYNQQYHIYFIMFYFPLFPIFL